MNKRLIELAAALGLVLAYILLKALATFLAVDLGELGPMLKQVLEMALPMGAGALIFPRPSDAAALKASEE